MKILQLCKKFPYPIKDGESLAIINLSQSLVKNDCELSLLAMNTFRHQVEPDLSAKKLAHYSKISVIPVDNRIKPKEAFLNLFSADSYHIIRFVSKDYKDALIRLLREETFDLIQLETLYLTPYIATIRAHAPSAVIALRAHNIEHEIWERIAYNTPNPLKKLYLSYLTRKLKNFELAQLGAFDILVAISERDRIQFLNTPKAKIKDSITTPIGVNPTIYEPVFKSYQGALSLSFIGSLDWMPNIEGIKWFLEEIWPVIRKEFPELSLHIAGRNCPDWLKNADYHGVVIVGEVESAAVFINAHPIMVVPLLSGSGMRVKILEGMALGRTVITTTIGLEGIFAIDRQEVMVADDVSAFVSAIKHLSIEQNALQIGQNARVFIQQNFDSEQIASDLKDAYDRLISKL